MSRPETPDPATSPFRPLPDLAAGAGAPRRVGVELEFGGLSPDIAAEIVGATLGGRVTAVSASEWRVEGIHAGGEQIEAVDIYLDSKFRPEGQGRAAEAGVALARQVVPIEIVTPPLPQAALPVLDRLVPALRAAGAEGSRTHVLHGFGLHLNVALADPRSGRDLTPVTRAFALLEPWLRDRDPLDLSRRVLPFTRPFPERFVDDLAAVPHDAPAGAVFDAIDARIATRNHGLDLLPAYAELAPERFARHPGATDAVSARPAYHYRMGESRLDEPGWSLAYDWTRWWLVERVAADPDLAGRLAQAWQSARRAAPGDAGESYHAEVTAALGPLAALAPRDGPAATQAGLPGA